MNSVIYKITNCINCKIYIGSTINIKTRWNEHKNKLNNGTHENICLQRAWNKYKEKSFKFEILEEVLDKSKILNREQYYIDNLEPEYNICKIAGNCLGVKHSEKTIQLFSEQRSGKKNPMYGRQHSKETKMLIGLRSIGRKGGGRKKGCIPWNKGLTKECDSRVKVNVERMAETRYGN